MISNTPLVTVITPTYNRGSLITETIDSVLSQTYVNFEYLIIDDGSTDNTEEVVANYLIDSRVRYYKFENKGEPESVNRGWNLANGDYFLQINSDDILLEDCLDKMVAALENNKKAVCAYPDFFIVDSSGKNIIQHVKSPNWNFIEALSSFSCFAAAPGTMIRRSSFSSWKKLRNNKFVYINDIEMFWNMALVGNFIHVPYPLAKWRTHNSNISSTRYQSIYECDTWYKKFFSENKFNDSIREETRRSVDQYAWKLLQKTDMSEIDKLKAYNKYLGSRMSNLQIGDNDLVGNKFNGHDLHLYLREKGIASHHLVLNKQSDDFYTHTYPKHDKYAILSSPFFLTADIVHLHLIHNNVMDVDMLPIISKLKPLVWTIHDPWAVGGHCIHHFDCEKWKSHCGDCPYVDKPFAIKVDDSALRFELKKEAIQSSQISAIVASKWIENQIKQSPIWKNKKVYFVPFGISHDLFKPPEDKKSIKERLGINPTDFVLFFRSDSSPYKGLDVIKNTLNYLDGHKVTVITVGQTGNLEEFSGKYSIKEFGWLTDDKELVELYQACDLFLMPSKQEAFGMMAIEAMSCGKLVVVLNGDTALPNTVNAPECGVAVDEKDYPQMVQRLLQNPQEIAERELKCLEYAKKEYDKNVYIERLIDVYTDVIKRFKSSESSVYLLEQLEIHKLVPTTKKKKFSIFYRYLLRPALIGLMSKKVVKQKYDKMFDRS